MMKHGIRISTYARLTGWADEQHSFDIQPRAPYSNDIKCIRSISIQEELSNYILTFYSVYFQFGMVRSSIKREEVN